MRTRNEIVTSSSHTCDKHGLLNPADLKLEVLLDIRDLLVSSDTALHAVAERMSESNSCGHGNRGWCPYCALAIHNGYLP